MSLWDRVGSAADVATFLGLGSSPPPLLVPTWLSRSSMEPLFLGLDGAGAGVAAGSDVGLTDGAASVGPLATALPPLPDVFLFSGAPLSSPGFSSFATALAGSTGAGAAGLAATAGTGAGGGNAGTTICVGAGGAGAGADTTL